MNRTLATLAALGAAASVVLAADVMGQEIRLGDSGQGSRPVYGRVVSVEQRADLVALLTLDNGIQISVPASSKLSADEPRANSTVVGRYIENGGQKIATSLSVFEDQAP